MDSRSTERSCPHCDAPLRRRLVLSPGRFRGGTLGIAIHAAILVAAYWCVGLSMLFLGVMLAVAGSVYRMYDPGVPVRLSRCQHCRGYAGHESLPDPGAPGALK